MKTFGEYHKLVRLANKLFAFYGQPVYLVGSGLYENRPRDYDLICVLPDEQFEIRYCAVDAFTSAFDEGIIKKYFVEGYLRWVEDCVKKSLLGMEYARKNIDFKVLPKSYCEKYWGKEERLQLSVQLDECNEETLRESKDAGKAKFREFVCAKAE